MSRTDKDRPWRVKIADRTLPLIEEHNHHSHYSWRINAVREFGECDLPDEPPVMGPHDYPLGCSYHLPSWHEGGRIFADGCAPHWYRHSTWTGPERTRERDSLREASKAYNSHAHDEDDFDYDFPNFQHRHRSTWMWH